MRPGRSRFNRATRRRSWVGRRSVGPAQGLAEEGDWISSGRLEVRLAATGAEVRAAQALRYRVFYEEMSARPSVGMAILGRDFDRFDGYCDHLLVIDHERGDGPAGIVGTYRLLRRSGAERCGRFYSEDEYDISDLLRYPGEILELGRSCIDPAYRDGPAMQLLWRGVTKYVFRNGIDLMFGCASFPGADAARHAEALAYLHRRHLAPAGLCPRALPARRVDHAAYVAETPDERQALVQLPPLIKGYLRAGASIGDGAVLDRRFGTIDVAIVLRTAQITPKYYRRWERLARDAMPA